MISAIGRKAQVQLCEDTLTAGVFDTLLLLPHEVFWKILTNAPKESFLPKSCEPIEKYEFWPKWNSSETGNACFVEPDLFLRFKSFDVIIEAKRWDFVGQDLQQWGNEIQSYLNEYRHDKKKFFFLAIGGNPNQDKESCIEKEKREVQITKCHWFALLNEIMRMLEETEKPPTTDSTYSTCAILRTAIKYLEIHGYIQMEWLATLKEKICVNEIVFENSSATVLNWKPEEWKYE